MNKLSETAKASLADVFCHGCWGVSFLASRICLNQTDVFTLLSHRFLIAFLLMHLRPRELRSMRLSRRQVLLLLALGLAQPVFYFFGEQYGILHSTTSFSGLMIGMIPIFSTLAAWPFLREKPTPGQLIFGVLSVAGVIGIGLLSRSSGRLDWIGVAALILAVCSATAYTLLGRSLSRTTSAYARTYAMMGIGAVVFTMIALIRGRGDVAAYVRPIGDWHYTLPMLFLSVFCSVLCFFCSSYALTRLPVARETAFANLTTAVSVFVGVVFLREPFSWAALGFTALILLGIWGVQRSSKNA